MGLIHSKDKQIYINFNCRHSYKKKIGPEIRANCLVTLQKNVMNISISGAGGFIGTALSRAFQARGWTVKPISRGSLSLPDDEFRQSRIEGSDVVINLAGASISKKWNKEYKDEILSSRLDTTRKIVTAITRSVQKPGLLISASAVDIYDNSGTHDDESTSFAGSFLGKVCLEWEQEALKVSADCRLVITRMGLVLGDNGGALDKMHLPFSLGLGAVVGKGDQWISFIHIKDLVNAFIFIIENPSVQGPVNVVSPYPVTNRDFSKTLGKVLKQPVFLSVPSGLMTRLYGEGASVLLEGRKVLPGKLTEAGFHFTYPTITNSLVNLFG